MRTALLSAVSHDLRTPLSSAMAAVESLANLATNAVHGVETVLLLVVLGTVAAAFAGAASYSGSHQEAVWPSAFSVPGHSLVGDTGIEPLTSSV
jgi:hypothetical protein